MALKKDKRDEEERKNHNKEIVEAINQHIDTDQNGKVAGAATITDANVLLFIDMDNFPDD